MLLGTNWCCSDSVSIKFFTDGSIDFNLAVTEFKDGNELPTSTTQSKFASNKTMKIKAITINKIGISSHITVADMPDPSFTTLVKVSFTKVVNLAENTLPRFNEFFFPTR